MAFPYVIMAVVFLAMALSNIIVPGSVLGMRRNQDLFKTNPLAKKYLQRCNLLLLISSGLYIATYVFFVQRFNFKTLTVPLLFLVLVVSVSPIRKYSARLKQLASEQEARS
ncbi:hypothetical protein [Aureicoccus marinus]|uniref:DUF3784 domain-containing protein n=1 Tax=Aureicoccus marinus TaxID=754435 RepID=A0A2S7T6E8_9FLAO|nr:hypothetical protein [Aureicoccus marinus]PQJ15489.1 hypothetical protein BST99_06835 [Aureicoccus marinus]